MEYIRAARHYSTLWLIYILMLLNKKYILIGPRNRNESVYLGKYNDLNSSQKAPKYCKQVINWGS